MLRIMILSILVSLVFGQTVILNVASTQQQQQQSTVFNPLQQLQQPFPQFPLPAQFFQNYRLPTIEELNEGLIAVQNALQELQRKLQANQPTFQDFFQNLFDLASSKFEDKIQANPGSLPDFQTRVGDRVSKLWTAL